MSDLTVTQKYADPQVVAFWQSLAEQGLQQAELEMVRRYLPLTGHLLDLGCGAGRAMLALNQHSYTVTGIDLSLPMLHAGRDLSAEMKMGGANLLSLPFAGNSFTAAFMFFGALQHIPGRANRQQALAQMARVVQPGGQLILGLDNLAPALLCYAYWLSARLNTVTHSNNCISPSPTLRVPISSSSTADDTLWQPRTHPLVWHLRGLKRSLRWRTLPGLVDTLRYASLLPGELGDTQVAQFSQPATKGKVYYHIYRASELIEDASFAGWEPLGFHAGRELSEGVTYPPSIRERDKQLFFAFEKRRMTNDG